MLDMAPFTSFRVTSLGPASGLVFGDAVQR